MPKKPKRKVNKGNKKNKNGVSETASSNFRAPSASTSAAEFNQSVDRNNENVSENANEAEPGEIRRLIKTNSIKLDSVKSKQDVVIKNIESVQDIILVKDEVNKDTHNLSECAEVKNIRSEYQKFHADLSHQLTIINGKLARIEASVNNLKI